MNWSITPRTRSSLGRAAEPRIEIECDPEMAPAEALRFALALIDVATRYVTIEDK